MTANLEPGLTGHSEWIVTSAMTATQVGSGTVAVFATPMLVALMESAAIDALKGHLPPGQTSVGTRIDVQHTAATPVRAAVRATAVLKAVEGRRLIFSIEAWDSIEKIGEATHERFLVDQARFEAQAAGKQ